MSSVNLSNVRHSAQALDIYSQLRLESWDPEEREDTMVHYRGNKTLKFQ